MSEEHATPPAELWACLPDGSDSCQVKFATRGEALAALEGGTGSLLRCKEGYPREGIEFIFDIAEVLSRLEEKAQHEGQVLANFEAGIFNVDVVQEDDLRRRLADAVAAWAQTVKPACWTILEAEDIEEKTNAKDAVP